METGVTIILLLIGLISGWILRHKIEVKRLTVLSEQGKLDEALESKGGVFDIGKKH